MKAKLVKHESKHESGYILFDEKGIPIGATPNVLSNGTFSKLSIKNCQAIERGYDLDELAEEWVFETNGHKWSNNDDTAGDNYLSFRVGFQKALELMGDKFSEQDVKKAITDFYLNDKLLTEKNLNDSIQSLQQTEWDVEIVTESIPADRAPNGWDTFPKLDADGCLILKRI